MCTIYSGDETMTATINDPTTARGAGRVGPSEESTRDQPDVESRPEARRSVLTRIALILDAFETDSVLSLGELTDWTGLPRSTTYRLAEQLLAVGWLDRVRSGYRIGMRMFELGGLAPNATKIRTSAAPWMVQAHEQSRMTVHLGVLDGDEVVYLDKLSPRRVDVPTRVGGRRPAPSTALGKVMLAFESEGHRSEVLTASAHESGPAAEALHLDLRRTQADGVATEASESVHGLACVAAPVRGLGRAIAAVSITGPAEEFNYRRYAGIVKAAANGIWQDLFGAPSH